MLNDEHRVVNDLDIYAHAGGIGIEHDEVVPFSINDGKLRVFDEVSDFNGRLRITFLKVRVEPSTAATPLFSPLNGSL